jgi:hypothetical protein
VVNIVYSQQVNSRLSGIKEYVMATKKTKRPNPTAFRFNPHMLEAIDAEVERLNREKPKQQHSRKSVIETCLARDFYFGQLNGKVDITQFRLCDPNNLDDVFRLYTVFLGARLKKDGYKEEGRGLVSGPKDIFPEPLFQGKAAESFRLRVIDMFFKEGLEIETIAEQWQLSTGTISRIVNREARKLFAHSEIEAKAMLKQLNHEIAEAQRAIEISEAEGLSSEVVKETAMNLYKKHDEFMKRNKMGRYAENETTEEQTDTKEKG